MLSPRIALPIALLCGSLLTPHTAAAQTPDQRALEIYGGYSYLRDPGGSVLAATSDDDSFRLGWTAGAAWNVWRAIAGVGEVSGHYKSKTTFDDDVKLSFHGFLGGPRASATVGRFGEFVQVLAGAVRASGSAFGETVTTTALALQPGGGVDYPLGARWRARLQFDYRWIKGAENRNAARQFRASATIVYR